MEMHTASSLYRVHGFALGSGRNAGSEIQQTARQLANWAYAAAGGVIAAYTRTFRAWKAIEQLQQMDDRMLADIGLTRGAIPQAVRFGRACMDDADQSRSIGFTQEDIRTLRGWQRAYR